MAGWANTQPGAGFNPRPREGGDTNNLSCWYINSFYYFFANSLDIGKTFFRKIHNFSKFIYLQLLTSSANLPDKS